MANQASPTDSVPHRWRVNEYQGIQKPESNSVWDTKTKSGHRIDKTDPIGQLFGIMSKDARYLILKHQQQMHNGQAEQNILS